MNTLFLKPLGTARVLNPDQNPPQPLPVNGLRVVDSLYWRRKLAEGVVEEASPKTAAKKAKE